ncbi:MAG: hypothetical protein QOH91_2928 [Mycobacterium sp.]|jgi:O-methyltransferase involved in polyketide biosynthesis|nr:hypothetical protein [Mycobacterium sp.]
MRRHSERWNRHGLQFDMAGLVYFDDRTDARTYLESHGWQTASVSTTDLLARHGLPPIDDDNDGGAPFGEVIYVSAELEAK